jgi:hypothetical protein
MYLLKIKSISGKSDYIQIRDDDFTLIAYFRFSNLHRALANANLAELENKIKELIVNAEYGKIIRINAEL